MGILLILIIFLLGITVDYAANDTVSVESENTRLNTSGTLIDGEYYVLPNSSGKAVKDNKTHTVKQKINIVDIVAKPSCGCNYREPNKYKYKWYNSSFIDYCPKCGHYNVLKNVYKPTAKYEYELTCTHCDADYCGVCGKDKFSWSHYYITKV